LPASFESRSAIAALVVAYQRDVGTSLIWLGETLTGKTKASQELPETKPAPVKSNPPALEANSPAPQNTGGDSTAQKPEDRDPQQATAQSLRQGGEHRHDSLPKGVRHRGCAARSTTKLRGVEAILAKNASAVRRIFVVTV